MPSPFPGMDPFIESQRWRDFHTRFLTVISDVLMAYVAPRFTIELEQYVYLVDEDEAQLGYLGPDLSLADARKRVDNGRGLPGDREVVATLGLKLLTHTSPIEVEQHTVVIKTVDGRQVITAIEVLSPWNKSGKGGQKEYLLKRQNYLHSLVNLVEVDLLRDGLRLPQQEPLPPGDYFTFVTRWESHLQVEVYSWDLEDPLPTVPVPLKPEMKDVPLDLAEAFRLVYDRAGYQYALNYERELSPPLHPDRSKWVQSVLKQ